MKINITIKIIIATLLIYLLSKYELLDFSILFTLDLLLSIKIIGLKSIIIIIGSLKWHFLVNAQNKNITLRETFESYYLGYALNYMLFGIAGDVIKTIYLVQNKENEIGISLSVVIDRAIGLLSMLMILIIFLPKIFINSNIFDINSIFHNVNHYYSFISIFFIVFLLFIRKCLNS